MPRGGGVRHMSRGSSAQAQSQAPASASEQGEVGDSNSSLASQQRICSTRILLKVDRDGFDPSNASRNLVLIFKKSFSGPWPTWSKIPSYVRDRWFGEFQKIYNWAEDDHLAVRRHFERKGSTSLSNSLNKAKKQYHEKNIIPKWINRNHWDELLAYWNTNEFKDKSDINSSNRKSSVDDQGPSLHTGGSIPISEYKRRYVKEKGREPSASELFLMTHKTKGNNDWVDTKSKSVWDKFATIIKRRRLDNNEEGNEDPTVDEEEEDDDNGDDAFMEMVHALPKEVVDNAWLEATGGPIKGRVYGLGSESATVIHGANFISKDSTSPSSSQTASSQNLVDNPAFEEAVNRLVEQKIADMRTSFQEQLQAGIQAAIQAMHQSEPQASNRDTGSAA